MITVGRIEPLILFVGDLIFFFTSLWVTLIIRYFEVPTKAVWELHAIPFSLLFVAWVAVFFIAGLYGKHTLVFKAKLPSTIFNAQVVNITLAAIFFFAIPIFGIAPKTNLVIYLIVSSLLVIFWRLVMFPMFRVRKPARGVLVGSGEEIQELEAEVNNNTRYGIHFEAVIHVDTFTNEKELLEDIIQTVQTHRATLLVIDSKDERVLPVLPGLYTLMFDDIRIFDITKIYEEIFDRIPLTFVRQNWLLDNVSFQRKPVYDILKRTFDIVVASILGTLSLLLYPLVILATLVSDRGSIFYTQERIGRNGKTIKLSKFRSMSETEKEKVTPVGAFLRGSRIDELPQLWAVIKGDLSLIGPRPEIPTLVALYEQNVPYYNIRHLIKPGLSGWAQTHQDKPPKFGVQYDETSLKLSYDLFYVKNRSIVIDFKIALFTLKTLLSRSGL